MISEKIKDSEIFEILKKSKKLQEDIYNHTPVWKYILFSIFTLNIYQYVWIKKTWMTILAQEYLLGKKLFFSDGVGGSSPKGLAIQTMTGGELRTLFLETDRLLERNDILVSEMKYLKLWIALYYIFICAFICSFFGGSFFRILYFLPFYLLSSVFIIPLVIKMNKYYIQQISYKDDDF